MNIFRNKLPKNLFRNIYYAFLAQSISLLLNIVMSLVVPKILGVTEYSYWQLYVFYVGYVGFFHFGLNDGIYLRLGGQKYKEINHSLLGTQLKLLLILEVTISSIMAIVGVNFIEDPNRQFIIIMAGIYLVLANITLYLGYIFQAVNKTKVFSMSVLIDRCFVLMSIFILMFLNTQQFQFFVIVYLTSKILSLIYCGYLGRDIVLAKWFNIGQAIKEMWINISIGIKLVIANIASMLILGSGRFIIDKIWGVTAFGKVSLSISLTNFFLVFIAQTSMVLFPTLRRIEKGQLTKIYLIMRELLGVFLPIVFLTYFPIMLLLEKWLPDYKESLHYLILLLPLCTFDGKMQLLCNTFFKVLRKEKILLVNNILSMTLSIVLSTICGYIFHSITLVILAIVVSVAVRGILSDIYLAKLMNRPIISNLIGEIVIVVIFIYSAWYLSPGLAFLIFFASYIVYLIINIKTIKQLSRYVFQR